MAKINILPAQVYNRIAAGEVVDRPYSIVKELVENSIDAGATEIEIYIENGGKQLVRVVDNGCGIEREDLQSAFLPHATSKIAKAEDLENIRTLGFRGEAVASIAAVSKMTIISQTAGQKCYSLTSHGGVLGGIREAAGEKGTDVRVEMLFFNAPVRLNFLKKDKQEEAEITTFVSRFILNRSDIAFTYYVNGQKVLQSFGGGDEEALVCVYGAATRKQCIEINAERHGIRVRGYIGNQNFFKANKSYQNVFLNGRCVVNATISAAIAAAYKNYIMKRQYPFCVLHITLPTEIVDVNVHPNKADVRFADNNIIFGCIYRILSEVLDGSAKALDYVVQTEISQEETTEKSPVKSISEEILKQAEHSPRPFSFGGETKTPDCVFDLGKKKTTFGVVTPTYEEAQKEIQENAPAFKAWRKETPSKGFTPIEEIGEFDESKLVTLKEGETLRAKKTGNPEKLMKMFPGVKVGQDMLEFHSPSYGDAPPVSAEPVDYFAENKRYLEELEKKNEQRKVDVSSFVYVGKAFNTYLIYQYAENLYLIDQHAAHERLIFDRLKDKMKNRQVARQTMLLPYDLEVNPTEAAFLREHLSDIKDMGFDIEENQQNAFLITAIPVDLPKIDLADFFNQILTEIDSFKAIKLEEVLKDKIASAACKAAVKGGMDLTSEEISELLKQMQGNMGLKCPHGRPVVVEISKTEIEKMFKRIV